jgi:hypothetical protein
VMPDQAVKGKEMQLLLASGSGLAVTLRSTIRSTIR